MISKFEKYILNEKSKNFFDDYNSILIVIKSEEELDYVLNYINNDLKGLVYNNLDKFFKINITEYLKKGKRTYIRYKREENNFSYGSLEYLESINSPTSGEDFFTVDELPKLKSLIINNGLLQPSLQPKKFVYESKSYFDDYDSIILTVDDENQPRIIVDYINKEIGDILDKKMTGGFVSGSIDELREGGRPYFRYNYDTNHFTRGNLYWLETEGANNYKFEKYYNFNDLNKVVDIIKKKGIIAPNLGPRKFIYESKKYFDTYKSIPIELNSRSDIERAFDYIEKNINEFLDTTISEGTKQGVINYLNEGRKPCFLYYRADNMFFYGTKDHLEMDKLEYWNYDKFYTVNDLSEVKNLIMYDGIKLPSLEPRKFVYENKEYFKQYTHIPIIMNSEEEVHKVYNFIKDNIDSELDVKIKVDHLNGSLDYIKRGQIPNLIYYYGEDAFRYGRASYTEENNFNYKKFYTVNDLPEVEKLIKQRYLEAPSLKPKTFIYENANLLLEKSSLTKLGVPREVMQSIQKDLALSPDVEWEKMNHKKDIVDYLKKGDLNLFIQIAIDSIKVIGSYPSPKGTIYFVDIYVYRDTDWTGEFEKLKRQYDTLTQTLIHVDPRTNIYRLKGDFAVNKQSKRKMIKKEKSFMDFSDKFKTDFLKHFDKILKRITGTNFKNAKDKVTDKAKKIAVENNLLIRGLDNPMDGPNGLTILDEFLYQFEDAYSEYFEERIDIQELSKYFTLEKVRMMFMYYIYTGKILVN